MKKLSVILLFAIAAFVFTGCSEDETSVRWRKNTSNSMYVNAIRWTDENNYTKQTWEETLTNDGERTAFQNVPNKTGKGFAFFEDYGDEAQIEIDGSPSAVSLAEGESQELVITSYAKK